MRIRSICWCPCTSWNSRRRAGRPQADLARALTLPSDLGERGDVLIYGGGKRGQAGALAGRLAQAIAVMAFLPGGVHLFGRHWVARSAAASNIEGDQQPMNTLDPVPW